jgi:hypothetical protein
MTYTSPQLVELYISRIVCLHGVPNKIMSDKGTQFTLKFWERLHETMDTVTPSLQNDGVNQDHVEGFSVRREFTSTCIQAIIIVL